MSKKEEFKEFLRNKPELIEYIKNKDMTLQSFYEIYDIYGDNEEAWRPYQKEERKDSISTSNLKISDIMKNINVDELQKHITTAQKALGVVEDLTTKSVSNVTESLKGPLTSRPLNKFFED